jgi:hypothetical protein
MLDYNISGTAVTRDVLTLRPEGNVGIGTTSPNNILHVSSAGSDTYVRIGNNAGYDAGLYFNTSTDWTIGTDTSNSNAFTIGNGSSVGTSPKIVIQTGGNVGIGETSPDDKLHVSGGNIRIYSTNNANHLIIKNNATGTSGVFEERIKFLGWNNNENAAIIAMGNAYFGDPVNALAFQVSGVEAMRIKHGKNVLIGTTGLVSNYDSHAICRDSPSGYALIVKNSNTTTTNNTVMQLNRVETTATTGGYALIYRQGDAATGTNRWIVFANGNIQNTNNSYGSLSDERKKENIVDATPKLDDLMKVKVRNFNLKGEETKQIGVVAQELEEVFPGMINESKDPDSEDETLYKGVKYSVFVPILIKAIQELKADNDSLKVRIETLENN